MRHISTGDTVSRRKQDDKAALRVALLAQGENLANHVARELEETGFRTTLRRVEGNHAISNALVEFPANVILADLSHTPLAAWSAYRAARAIRPSAPFILLAESLDEESFVDFARYNPDDLVLVSNLARLGPAVQVALELRRPLATLSPRQLEVLVMVAEGQRTREIAERLGRSLKTVESHRGALMKRLGLSDVAAVVRYAVRMGLIADTIVRDAPRTSNGYERPLLRMRSPADFVESGGAVRRAPRVGNYQNYQR
jgi:DNA-binding NarL/FixJ family response regulator